MGETQKLADWVYKLNWNSIPEKTKIKTKKCLMEFLSCCLIARNEKPAQFLFHVLEKLGSNSQSSVIGRPDKLSVIQSAMVNGAMSHIWEIDDTHRYTLSHPGDSVIAAALAIGEWLKKDGVSILTSIVAGYEVAVRISSSVSPSHVSKGWHPTGTANTFGAAVASGKLLGLTNGQMAWALGLAATQAAGTFCHVPERAMSKDLNPGKAAANGLLSALLASEGFTGSPTAIENDKGFVHTHADSFNLDMLINGLSETFKIDEIAFKPYSCCRHCHAGIDALLYLRDAYNITPEQVSSITINTYPTAAWLVNDPDPFEKGFYGTRYSIQFNLALALIEGAEGLKRALFDQDFIQSMLLNPYIKEIMKKIKFNVNPELAQDFPNKWPSEVKISLTNDQIYQHLVEYPSGEPENPLPDEQLIDKFKRAGNGYLSAGEINEIVNMIDDLENLIDISNLLRKVSK